jgi:hypothetical protein
MEHPHVPHHQCLCRVPHAQWRVTRRAGAEVSARRVVRLEHSISAPFPAADTAGFVLDWGNDPLWRASVLRFTCEPSGRAVVGQHLLEELRFAGLTFRTRTVIRTATPLSASYAGGSGSIFVTGTRKVTRVDDCSCVVTTTTHLRLTGVMRACAPLLAPSYRRADRADLLRLPQVLAEALGQPSPGVRP